MNSTNERRQGCNIIVAEDDSSLLGTIGAFLSQSHHKVRTVKSAGEAWNELLAEPADVLVTDLKLPGRTGLELMREALEHYPDLIVIMMTGFASVDSAVQAMRQGAFDYLPKPFSMAQLSLAIDRAIETRSLRQENVRLREELRQRTSFDQIIGKSASMQRVFQLLEKVSPVDSTALIYGESGVGKELIVQALHDGHPLRRDNPLVAVHCGAIPEHLIESELFGHTRGAFTGADQDKPGQFEAADGGTLFLDEVGTMRADLQVKLLRVLQSRQITRVGGTRPIPVDVRVVAATNEDLREKVDKGTFREDLYYRLNVIPIHVPPLRDRMSDVPLLAAHFVSKYCARNGYAHKEISQDAMRVLMRRDWPGNVRQLENAIEYAVVMSPGNRIEPKFFAEGGDTRASQTMPFNLTEEGLDMVSLVSQIERDLILQSLEIAGGNKARAASQLGLKRTTYVEKLKRVLRDPAPERPFPTTSPTQPQ